MSLTSYRAAPSRVVFLFPGLPRYPEGLFSSPVLFVLRVLGPLVLRASRGLLHGASPRFRIACDAALVRDDGSGAQPEGRCARERSVEEVYKTAFSRPGGDLLSHTLRCSTIGAGEFHGRVRDGIGWGLPAGATRPAKRSFALQNWLDFCPHG